MCIYIPSIDRSIVLHRYMLTHISINKAILLLVPSHEDVSICSNNEHGNDFVYCNAVEPDYLIACSCTFLAFWSLGCL